MSDWFREGGWTWLVILAAVVLAMALTDIDPESRTGEGPRGCTGSGPTEYCW